MNHPELLNERVAAEKAKGQFLNKIVNIHLPKMERWIKTKYNEKYYWKENWYDQYL